MTAQPTTVTDEQVAGLEAALGRAGLVELTHAIALENMRARFNHALGITDQGFDAACAVPAGRAGIRVIPGQNRWEIPRRNTARSLSMDT